MSVYNGLPVPVRVARHPQRWKVGEPDLEPQTPANRTTGETQDRERCPMLSLPNGLRGTDVSRTVVYARFGEGSSLCGSDLTRCRNTSTTMARTTNKKRTI